MKIVKIILGITIIGLSVYGLTTENVGTIIPYMLLLTGLMFIVMSITEFKKRNADAFNLFLVSIFVLFVAIYSFF